MSHRGPGLFPSPPLFCSGIIDCNTDGYLAYGARQSVVVLDIRKIPPILHVTFIGHDDRINCVSFCKNRSTMLLAVASADGIMKIWNVEHVPAAVYSFSFPKDSGSLIKNIAISWCNGTETRGYVARGRMLIEWDVLKNCTRQFKKGNIREDILLLSSCPCDNDLLAAGHAGGLISIYSVSRQQSIHKLRRHYSDITAISWSPFLSSQFVTSSNDGTACLWTLDEEVKHKVLHLDNVSSRKRSDKGRVKPWVVALWHPTQLDRVITSNCYGDVITWGVLCEGKMNKEILSKDFAGQLGMVANLVCNEYDKNLVITYSRDRQLTFWDLKEMKSIFQTITLIGPVYSMALSPVDSGRLAIASGDNAYKVWNTASPKEYSIKTYYQGMKCRITCLTWHPCNDAIISIGTEDGRVGLFYHATNKGASFYNMQHKDTIYSLCWGPCAKMTGSGNEEFTPCLFSCGGGKIYVHPLNSHEKESLDFDDIADTPMIDERKKKPFHTEVTWKHDFSVVCIGNDDGYIDIYDGTEFLLVATIHSVKQIVQCLKWHPEYISMSSAKCAMHHWLACASGEPEVHVYELKTFVGHDENVPLKITEPTRLLKGHHSRTTCVVWSPHVAGRLASSSYDNTVQVWDVMSSQPIVNFQGHMGRIFSLEWSLLDPDILYSGSEDYMVLKWRISEQINVLPPKVKATSRKKKRNCYHLESHKFVSFKDEKLQDDSKTNAETAVCNNDSKINGAGIATSDQEIEEDLKEPDGESVGTKKVTVVSHAKGHKFKIRRKMRTFLGLSNSLFSQTKSELNDLCVKVTDSLLDGKEDSIFANEDLKILGYLGDEADVFRTIDADAQKCHEMGGEEYDGVHHVFKGDMAEYLRDVANKEQLDYFHLALAPLVSRSLWLELCEKFVAHNKRLRNYHVAATFLVACHKVYEAINLLADNVGLYEAFVLAKCRLPHSDPLIMDLMKRLCDQYETHDHCEIAGIFYLSMNRPLIAAQTISRAKDAPAFRTAAYICKKFGFPEEAKHFSTECVKRALLKNEWKIARSVVAEEPELKYLLLLCAVHESLAEHIKILKSDENCGLKRNLLRDVDFSEDRFVVYESYTISERGYLSHLFESLVTSGIIDLESDSFVPMINGLKVLLDQEHGSSRNLQEGLYFISLKIAAFAATILMENSDEKMNIVYGYINNVLTTCFSQKSTTKLFSIFCQLLFPFNVIWNCSDKTVSIEPAGVKSGVHSLQMSLDWLAECVCQSFKTKCSTDATSLNNMKNGDCFTAHQEVIEKAVSCVTVTEALLGNFAINFVELIWKQIVKDSIVFLCFQPSLNEIEVECTLNGESLDSGSVEVSSGAVPCSSPIAEESLSLEKIAGMENPANEQVPSGSCSETHVKELILDTVDSVEKIDVQEHPICENIADLLFCLLNTFSAFSCKAVYVIKCSLEKVKQRADHEILQLRVKEKHTMLCGSSEIAKSCVEDASEANNVSSSEQHEDSGCVVPDDKLVGTSVISEKNNLLSELEARVECITALQKSVEDKAKVKNFPDSLTAVSEIEELHKLLVEKKPCSSIKQKMDAVFEIIDSRSNSIMTVGKIECG